MRLNDNDFIDNNMNDTNDNNNKEFLRRAGLRKPGDQGVVKSESSWGVSESLM